MMREQSRHADLVLAFIELGLQTVILGERSLSSPSFCALMPSQPQAFMLSMPSQPQAFVL